MGSEMCIRDSGRGAAVWGLGPGAINTAGATRAGTGAGAGAGAGGRGAALHPASTGAISHCAARRKRSTKAMAALSP